MNHDASGAKPGNRCRLKSATSCAVISVRQAANSIRVGRAAAATERSQKLKRHSCAPSQAPRVAAGPTIAGVKILAFEAATRRISVALWCEGALTEQAAEIPHGGSELLLPWAHALLADAGLSLQQIDGFAFGAGPGGFTGLRLACGVVQGLAYGLDRPVLPVSTLAALALEAAGEQGGKVLAGLDARMNEVYLAAYRVHGGPPGEAVITRVSEEMPPKVGAGETVELPAGDGWRGVGDAFAAHGAVLQQRMGERLLAVDASLWPTARAVAQLAVPLLAQGGGVAAAQAVPLYIRDKVALTTAERLARGGMK